MHHFEAATCMLQQYTSPYNPSLRHISDHKLIHTSHWPKHTQCMRPLHPMHHWGLGRGQSAQTASGTATHLFSTLSKVRKLAASGPGRGSRRHGDKPASTKQMGQSKRKAAAPTCAGIRSHLTAARQWVRVMPGGIKQKVGSKMRRTTSPFYALHSLSWCPWCGIPHFGGKRLQLSWAMPDSRTAMCNSHVLTCSWQAKNWAFKIVCSLVFGQAASY